MTTKIHDSVLTTVGHTPLIRLGRLNKTSAEILAKVEFFNPGGSVKDRVGLAMIEEAEKNGQLAPEGLIIEPTSGNTGVGLALAAAVKGYRLILTMPETMSRERRALLAAFGAQIVLTDGALGMKGAIDKANEILSKNPDAYTPSQFSNPVNPAVHHRTTGPEIWNDAEGRVDCFVAGVGTGGTLTGVGRYLKEKNPDVRLVAVEPSDSPVLAGGAPGPHRLQGIGAGFVPQTMDLRLVSEIFPVTYADAQTTARQAARQEGLLVGVSSGAALFAALSVAERPESAGKRIIVLLPDTGERYLSGDLFDSP